MHIKEEDAIAIYFLFRGGLLTVAIFPTFSFSFLGDMVLSTTCKMCGVAYLEAIC